MSTKSTKALELDELRKACIDDLYTFARVVEPHRMYGEIHKKVFQSWGNPEAKDHQLVLLPRDHQKSHCMAVYAAWRITKAPDISILYISATATLAIKQLYDIKNILTNKYYKALWPDMTNDDEGRREKWTEHEICVDHPKRKAEGIRDSTVKAAGLTMTTTGLHCNLLIKDDVVVPDNVYTEDGRTKVDSVCSQLSSVLTTGGEEKVVGTRYHPRDHYAKLMEMEEEVFEGDEIVGREKVYEVIEYAVEDNGKFLWPRQMRSDGKAFGFDWKELARKKAKYLDKTQFYAQYYNNPNDPDSNRLDKSRFQYYDSDFLIVKGGSWKFKDKKLNIYSSIDFGFSTAARADWTAIVVIGINCDGEIYVLDIDRFKTNKVEEYFQHVLDLHRKWDFRKLRAEVTIAQQAVVEYLKDRARQQGLGLSIDEYRPTRHEGSKEERIAAILEPRYDNLSIWHPKAGWINALEEELILARPAHDDLKDALASAVAIAKAPPRFNEEEDNVVPFTFHPRFGGIRRPGVL